MNPIAVRLQEAAQNLAQEAQSARDTAASAFVHNAMPWRDAWEYAEALRYATTEFGSWQFEVDGTLAGLPEEADAVYALENWHKHNTKRLLRLVRDGLDSKDINYARGLAIALDVIERVLDATSTHATP